MYLRWTTYEEYKNCYQCTGFLAFIEVIYSVVASSRCVLVSLSLGGTTTNCVRSFCVFRYLHWELKNQTGHNFISLFFVSQVSTFPPPQLHLGLRSTGNRGLLSAPCVSRAALFLYYHPPEERKEERERRAERESLVTRLIVLCVTTPLPFEFAQPHDSRPHNGQ